jgi:hypothetical protein
MGWGECPTGQKIGCGKQANDGVQDVGVLDHW